MKRCRYYQYNQNDLQDQDGRHAKSEAAVPGFMVKGIHSKDRADAPADQGDGKQGGLRDAEGSFAGTVFVNSHDCKAEEVDCGKINDEKSGYMNHKGVLSDNCSEQIFIASIQKYICKNTAVQRRAYSYNKPPYGNCLSAISIWRFLIPVPAGTVTLISARQAPAFSWHVPW